MVKKTLAFSMIAGFILFVSVLFFSNVKEIFNTVVSLSLLKFFVVLAVFLLEILLVTYRWKIILKSLGYDSPVSKLFPAKAGCYAISYLTPFSRLGGEPVRAYILKKKTGIPFLKGFETTIEDKILEFTTTMAFVLCGIFILFLNYTLSRNVEITILSLVTLFLLLLGLFYFQTMRKKEVFNFIIRMFRIDKIKSFPEITKHVGELERNISQFFLNNRKTIFKAIFISSVANLILLLNSILLMHFVGYKITLANSLIIFSLTAFATTVPIPGALGAYEGFSALAFGLLGFTTGVGVAFSLLTRTIELSFVAIGVFFTYSYSIKLLISFLSDS